MSEHDAIPELQMGMQQVIKGCAQLISLATDAAQGPGERLSRRMAQWSWMKTRWLSGPRGRQPTDMARADWQHCQAVCRPTRPALYELEVSAVDLTCVPECCGRGQLAWKTALYCILRGPTREVLS